MKSQGNVPDLPPELFLPSNMVLNVARSSSFVSYLEVLSAEKEMHYVIITPLLLLHSAH